MNARGGEAGGLNVFLNLSHRLAVLQGELRLHHPVPVVRRLLGLTGTDYLLAEGYSGIDRVEFAPPSRPAEPHDQ